MNLAELIPPYHPLLRNPTQEEVVRAISTPKGREAYLDFLKKRAKRIADADDRNGDPFFHGWQLPHWKEADDELRLCGKGQFVAGGKRATKSERNAWRVCQAIYYLERGIVWALQSTSKTSIAEQQARVWRYLPREIKAMNGKSKHVGWARVDYNIERGFSNGILVMPNQSQLQFLTYEMEAKNYQGWEIGFPDTPHNREVLKQMPWLFNLGAWADEDMSEEWLKTIQFRCSTRDAVWMWTFSTLSGITPAIKSLKSAGSKIIRTARAELLPENQVLVPGCPPGHMPICERAAGGVSIFYFWTEFNPFPPNYKNVKDLVAGRPRLRIQRDAYGYDEDVRGKAYPKFGPWNIIDESELPEVGTDYMLTDPAGTRMWASIWVRVTDENPPRFFIWADWPDQDRFGEWAVPGTVQQPDGVAGPAQEGRGDGWLEYKQAWLEVELIEIPQKLLTMREQEKIDQSVVDQVLATVKDPKKRRVLAENWQSSNEGELFMPIEGSFIDPRAGADQKHQNEGSITPIDALAEDHKDKHGKVVPGRYFMPASGVSINTGRTAVNALLAWDQDQPLCRIVNEPRLYVTSKCQQVIGMFNEFTGLGGEKGGWKDFDDLLRYMATSPLDYVPEGRSSRRRQGSY